MIRLLNSEPPEALAKLRGGQTSCPRGTNRELAFAVKRALATGTIALCGAGVVAAYAQPAAATQTTPTQATATAKKKTSKVVSRNESIMLAQATTAAATGPSADQTQLQTIVITGSLIERTATESPNPVQVISSKDLVQSGYTDISDAPFPSPPSSRSRF